MVNSSSRDKDKAEDSFVEVEEKGSFLLDQDEEEN